MFAYTVCPKMLVMAMVVMLSDADIVRSICAGLGYRNNDCCATTLLILVVEAVIVAIADAVLS